MEKEFDFARNFEESDAKHKEWWLTLSPAQRWKSNWEHVELLRKSNPDLFQFTENRYILE